MADAKLQGLDKLKAKLAKVPVATQKALKGQLKIEADDMVSAIQRAMDVAYAGQNDKDLTRLRDSVHAYENPSRVIAYTILADAKDADGKFIGSHVEAGHRTVDGGHVAARPVFYPIYRSRKKAMKRRLNKAARDATKQAFEG
jgi:hypothetical protein